MIRFRLEGEKAIITHADPGDWRWLKLKLTWYTREGTLAQCVRGDLLKVSVGCEFKKGKIGIFEECTHSHFTLKFDDNSIADIQKKYLTRVVKESQIFVTSDGKPFVLKGVVNLIKKSAQFEVEIENPEVVNIERTTIKRDALKGINLLDFQKSAVEKALSLKKGLVVVPTGGGKTVICGAILRELLDSNRIKRGLIVVPSVVLADQLVSDCRGWGFSKLEIGAVHGDRKELESKIVVAVSNSVYIGIKSNSKNMLSILKESNLFLIDECFPGDQYVATEQGPKSIGRLYKDWSLGKELPMVHSFNESKKVFELNKIVKCSRKPMPNNLIKISCGLKKFVCTDNHKILTERGWIKAKDLLVGVDAIIGNCVDLKENHMPSCLNSDQRQVVLGSFLGDGHISHNKTRSVQSGKVRLRINHGPKQEKYLRWKALMFGVKVNKIESQGFTDHVFRMQTKSFHLGGEFPKNKKSCPQWILDDLDARGLAIWVMDDGSVNDTSVCLNTSSFDLESHNRIVASLKNKFGLNFVISSSNKKDGRSFLYLRGIKKEKEKLIKTIKPYITSCMPKNKLNGLTGKYKWDNSWCEYGLGTVSKKEIVSKDRWISRKSPWVYDLEIENNHNFVVCSVNNNSGFVAHNCQHLRSDTSVEIMKYIDHAEWSIGLSGSPFVSNDPFNDPGDVLIWGMTGGPVFSIDYAYLQSIGMIAEPVVFMAKTDGSMGKYPGRFQKIYDDGIVKNRKRNESIEKFTRHFVKNGFQTLILVQRLEHARLLMELLKDLRIVAVFGAKSGLIYEEQEGIINVNIDYDTIREEFQQGKYDVMIGSTVLDEGFNLPAIGAAIQAGGGKCFGKDTPILMYNRSIKNVQDITAGDLVMGDNGEPRLVKSTTTGFENLFKITPTSGISWVCNGSHNLIFRMDTHINKKLRPGYDIVMTVNDFVKHPLSSIRKHAVLFRPEVIDFKIKQNLVADPYWVGLWLGDGTYTSGAISCNIYDKEIENWLSDYARKFGLFISKQANTFSTKCFNIRISGGMENSKANRRILNPTWEFLKKYDNMKGKGNKYIPKEYLFSSVEDRWALLAGLVDSDGHVHNKSVEIATVYQTLADDITFLARSLGLKVNCMYSEREHSVNSRVKNGKIKRFRIGISGDFTKMPTKLPRKQIGERLSHLNTLHSTFSVTKEGEGQYFGFELDKPTFLLSDFTVVHNSMIKNLQRLGRSIRKKKVGRNRVYLVDFNDKSHIYLSSHSKKRKEIYEQANCTFVDDEFKFINMMVVHGKELKDLIGEEK